MQLFNVYHGGTLIFDIPTITNITGHAKVQGNDPINMDRPYLSVSLPVLQLTRSQSKTVDMLVHGHER